MGQHELSKGTQIESPVCTRIAGEKLIAQECAGDLLDENCIHQVVQTVKYQLGVDQSLHKLQLNRN